MKPDLPSIHSGNASSCPTSDTDRNPAAVLELRVRNHPGTMSHITGLFARRGFNLDAIVCVPLAGGATSRALLLIRKGKSLEQLERQLARLYDVMSIRHRADLDAEWFKALMGPLCDPRDSSSSQQV